MIWILIQDPSRSVQLTAQQLISNNKEENLQLRDHVARADTIHANPRRSPLNGK
jgi:hypothetical protein